MKRSIGSCLLIIACLLTLPFCRLEASAGTAAEETEETQYTFDVKFDTTALWSADSEKNRIYSAPDTAKTIEATADLNENGGLIFPNVFWYHAYSYDPETCTITMNGGQLYFALNSGRCVLGTDEVNLALSFSIYFDADSFGGLRFCDDGVVRINEDGTMKFKDLKDQTFQLADGWNTVTLYFLRTSVDEENSSSVYTVYCGLGELDTGAVFCESDLASMPHYEWSLNRETLADMFPQSGQPMKVYQITSSAGQTVPIRDIRIISLATGSVAAEEREILALLDSVTKTDTMAVRYGKLADAIAVYQTVSDRVSAEVTQTLTRAVDAYNALADAINHEMCDALGGAISITETMTGDTGLMALLSDIKSKIVD